MGRPHPSLAMAAAVAFAACDPAPTPPAPQEPVPAVEVEGEVATFYKARGFRPLWVTNAGPRPEAQRLLRMLNEADRDGLDPKAYDAPNLARVLDQARGDPAALARADLLLSSAFARYAADVRRTPAKGMFYVDAELAPKAPSPLRSLEAAARGLRPALTVNPLYEGLRRGLTPDRSPAEARLIRLNMERARAIQPPPGRYIIVDAAGAQLWLMEGGKIRDRMRAIVGKRGQETPMISGFIRFAVLKPYWNLPADITQTRVAKRVLRQGTGFLAREGLQTLSDWSPSARPIKPAQVNWRAVAAGTHKLRVRQLPGPGNVMGEIKFMLPNRLGIYLHDTPDKAAFARSDRRLSSGCVRVEDAPRLARWLFNGKPPTPRGSAPEQRVDLPEPVPVYITYMTALPGEGGRIVFQPDVYGRDAKP